MVKILYTFIAASVAVFAGFESHISEITPQIKARMLKGNSWKKGCPVPLKDLRYIRIKHIDFHGEEQMGEIIVHKEVSVEVSEIFESLYKIGYPIRKMRLVSDYKGSDWDSIESDNTSAFNCRTATGSKAWSKHSYGKAIDINPIENPYISRKGYISHKASAPYRKRVHQNATYADRAVLLKHDKAVEIFKKQGWQWGGDWSGVKDYQHFAK
ncbi:M15 family metallopeptidase [Sulfurovum sp. XGS-02]|uniref:M15 family metallopeptidase n=1 Tax=Sulfurovum sp. XGS-02 TaxID=2925411 RepID=UPI002068D184|nr:M15 family metallopeptidase [Sulfurovum sp. XGS-02]UPT77913.1 M15 family metallopeptidase [Sulfurovum sp. XGS-02]